ncbi:MAG: alkaline phosphatase [Phycisphaerales bacterium]
MPTDPHPSRPTPRLERRSFLKASTLGAAALSLGLGASPAPAVHTRRARPTKARNVIFMVSDGMSFGTLTLADMYRRQHHGRQSHWLELFSRPDVRRGLFATWSADSPVTDSAAAGSAWGCGRHIDNSAINITPDGVQKVPILVRARQGGKATGLATTTRLTHATPASFVANCPRRDWEEPIAEQMLERRVDVLLGGGAKFISEKKLGSQSDVSVVRTRAELLATMDGSQAAPGRLVGLFADSHLPFVLDRGGHVPSLREMTRAALGRLDRDSEGFVLQIEGGRVDHAAHANDAASIIAEQVEFDDAVAEALSFLDGGKRDDTLLIVTSDHGNANPGLTLYGKAGREGFDRVAEAKRSFEWITDRLHGLDAGAARKELGPLVEQATGVRLEEGDLDLVVGPLAGRRIAAFREMNALDSALGGVLANHFGISFVSGNHTSDYVEVTALGPGSERVAPTGHNVDLYRVMVEALALGPGALLPDMEEVVTFPKKPKPE